MSTVWWRDDGLEGVWWRGVERGGVGGWVGRNEEQGDGGVTRVCF